MVRLFEKHRKRKIYLLDGIWQFQTDPDNKGTGEGWYERFPDGSKEMIVPSCWNNEAGLYHYEGIAWYRKEFDVTGGTYKFIFHAVTGQAEVYMDGRNVKSHYGGFTPFSFLTEDLTPGKHQLIISVDNTHNSRDTIPLARVDWFHYGGITRSVEMMELKDIWFEDMRVDYEIDETLKNARLDISLDLKTLNGKFKKDKLSIFINNECVYRTQIEAQGSKKIKLPAIESKDILLWDTEEPNLYLIRAETDGDDIAERIGFRNVRCEDGRILVNDKEVFLKGVNRHEDHPDWGFSLPLKIMKKDMDIIKDLGCNSIRGSHYPNSEIFLDLCDQEGILFWEEIPLWQYHDEHFKNPLVMERALDMHTEMVQRDRHHPSIILWGLHNEVDTRIRSCYDFSKKLADKIRDMDSGRLITYATMHPLTDICLDLADVISINKYLGWYEGDMQDWSRFLADLGKEFENKDLSGKPVIISEFGAGAVFGERALEKRKWSEDYQDMYMDIVLKLFVDEPSLSGCFIWQYCDIRTARELEMSRPRSFNNKGIVNEYRKPKMAYKTVKKIYSR
jgi:beta-glucuronidase